MWYTDPDITIAASTLLHKERTLSVSHLSRQSTFLPKYWVVNETNERWAWHFVRQLLRNWAAENEDVFSRKMPNSPESVWDHAFHFPVPVTRPWFIDNPWYIKNQQGLLLRMDWEGYRSLFPYYKTKQGFPHLIPSVHKDAWMIDGQPINCDVEYLNRLGYLPRNFKARS